MSVLKRISAVFALSAATACAQTLDTQPRQTQPQVQSPCKFESAPEEPFEYATMTKQGTAFSVRYPEGKDVSDKDREEAAQIYADVVKRGGIIILEAEQFTKGASCGTPSFTFLFRKDIADRLEDDNVSPDSGLIVDFNGSADNIDMPAIWLNDAKLDGVVNVNGQDYYRIKIGDPLAPETVNQIEKARGFVLPFP